MNLNLDTNINNLAYLLYMEEQESKCGDDNDKSKSHLEREQTAPMRK